jgi:hypothetical protein
VARTPQDPRHHAEGDVATHVRMVEAELLALPTYLSLPPPERDIVHAAALLHDIAKPSCTRREGDRITSHGHSARGAIDARRMLWRMEAPFAAREAVCALVRHHMVPMRGIDRDDVDKLVFRVSQTARCDLLCVLAEADARGRVCQDQARLLDDIALFRVYCADKGCLHGPRLFPSDHSRFLYFRSEARDPDYLAWDDTTCMFTLLSGLPANLVWNATNLSREIRQQVIGLAANYNARVEVAYVEVRPPCSTSATGVASIRCRKLRSNGCWTDGKFQTSPKPTSSHTR